jgi:predicted esterase
VAAVVALLLAGCASPPPDLYSAETVPAALATTGAIGVRDLRADYRQAVCRHLPSADDSCNRWLLRLSGEGVAAADAASLAPVPAALAQRYRIAFVPGFMAECFEQLARPFADAERDLRRRGFTVDYFQVSGRGSTAANARRLARHFESLGEDPRPIILFAYSKGLPDTLDFTATYPGPAARIAAVVSVAGAVNGSPLADDLLPSYRKWLADLPLPGCEVGNGDELHDLRRDVRLAWWRKHGAQLKVPVFTLVAAPRPQQVSPGTRGTYRWLARVDPRNDGKLLWTDQIVPSSLLLGYANADHWTIAIPVGEELPALAPLFRDGVPCSALVEGAIEVVAQTLADGAPR